VLTRRALGLAAAAAALAVSVVPGTASAQMCRIVIDPHDVWTPVGTIHDVPFVYCVSP